MTRSRRWPRRVLALAVVVELFGGGGALYFLSLDSATVVPRGDVVDAFRNRQRSAGASEVDGALEAPAAPAGAPTPTSTPGDPGSPHTTATTATSVPGPDAEDPFVLPAPGVYVYTTTGYETISLGSTRHDYPSETTVTVTHEGCGLRGRWDILEERWDEWQNCVTEAGEEWGVFSTFHEFFDQKDIRNYKCEPGSVLRPRRMEAGMTWTSRCAEDTSWFEEEATIVGVEAVTVGDQRVDAWRVRMQSTSGGDTRGGGVHEYWFAPESSQIVRMTGSFDSESDSPFPGGGPVDYHEEYDVVLKSLQPQT